MEPIKITIFQAYIFWENIDNNLKNLSTRLAALREKTDLIILPEMFNTGFTNNVEKCAEKPNGKTMRWMFAMAQQFDCVIAGSLIIEEDGKYYNRFIWMSADGSYVKYDKRHLFGLGGEHEFYTAGDSRVVVNLKGWKVSPMICYDLRFPVWSRNQQGAYDLLIYIASWPDKRSAHWRALLPARAIENQAFVIGVNRVGHDGNEIYYSGGSMCIGPNGDVVYYKPEDEDLYTFTLSPKDLLAVRERFPFLKDADNFTITP
ncbi:amidohydrolase [Sphingobacteriaceae bacterium WQ 2009]|uniref:Omega-amidase YafV n=1 Tax=Rhinopithecimicrobium faecis TaxID=2820698 RepID=A0A8T4H655_9SPHI|nr:amidohydrolase [Sphingobacteriaceae bacterium WQ 2009]